MHERPELGHATPPLIITVALLTIATIASADTFRRPLSEPITLKQGFDQLSEKGHHTGWDMWSNDSAVYASEAGTVVDLVPNNPCPHPDNDKCGLAGCADHGMGNSVILEHRLSDGTIVYSLYAHLASYGGLLDSEDPPLFKGRCVKRGEIIGRMGGSGNGCPDAYPVHLHFEIKREGTLGAPGNTIEWGYTKGPAETEGYFNPADYVGLKEGDCNLTTETAGQTIRWPLDTFGRITQDFGCRGGPPLIPGSQEPRDCGKQAEFHTGIDTYSGGAGESVHSVMDGTVCALRDDFDGSPGAGFGNAIIVQHSDTLFTLYGHLQNWPSLRWSIGASVTESSEIGLVGATNDGRIPGMGAHLHFEVKKTCAFGRGYSSNAPSAGPEYKDPFDLLSTEGLLPILSIVEVVPDEDRPLDQTPDPDRPSLPALQVWRAPSDINSGLPCQPSVNPNCRFAFVSPGQRFVALARRTVGSGDTWYRIHLPCRQGTCAGWIRGDYNGRTYSRPLLGGSIIFAPDGPSSGVEILDRADWNKKTTVDRFFSGQALAIVQFQQAGGGCSTKWWQVDLAVQTVVDGDPLEPVRRGWVCGDNVTFEDLGSCSLTANAPASSSQQCAIPSDTTPPLLLVAAPTNGATSMAVPVMVRGTASDAGRGASGISSVKVNGVHSMGGASGGASTANWYTTLTLAPGPNTIIVVATDGAGNQATSQIDVSYFPPVGCYAMQLGSAATSQGTAAVLSGQTCPGGFTTGSRVSIGATPLPGYQFSSWTATGCTLANPSAPTTTCTMSSGNATVTASFATMPPGTGSIRLSIEPPAAADAGAQWQFAGETSWRASGSIATALPLGTYTIRFKDVSGWTTPADQSVTLSPANRDVWVNSGSYVQPAQVVLSAPSNLQAVANSSGGIDLSWVDNSASPNEGAFKLEYRFGGATAFSHRYWLTADTNSYNDESGVAGTTWCYRLAAHSFTSGATSGWSNEACAVRQGRGGVPYCDSFSISPTRVSVDSRLWQKDVKVSGSSPLGCAGGYWTATGNEPWLTVPGGAGDGNGNAGFWIASNSSSSSRTGTLTIAGKTVTVTQAAAGNPAIDTEAPSVSIVAPTSNTTYPVPSTPIVLLGNAGDDVEVIGLTCMNETTGVSVQASWPLVGTWTCGLSLAPGVNAISARASDASGKSSSASVAVTYDPDQDPLGHTRIAFASDRDTLNARLQLYTIRPDGSSLTRLTNNSGHEERPIWSPDGHRIAFSTNREGGRYQIYMMGADGSDQHRLVATPTDGDDMAGSFSPNGRRVAFWSNRDAPAGAPGGGPSEIYLMDDDGTNVERLTDNASDDRMPLFAPDGSQIAFASDRTVTGHHEVWVMNIDGSEPRQVTTSAYSAFPADWTPDGSAIIYSMGPSRPEASLFTIRPDGSGKAAFPGGERGASASYSPDRTRMVFTTDLATEGRLDDLHIIDAAGGRPTRITFDNSRKHGARWSPVPQSLITSPAAPAGVVAAATTATSVVITWSPVSEAAKYRVYRTSDALTYQQINDETTTGTSFIDDGATSNTAYLYRIRAVSATGIESVDSNPDLATTVMFTDPAIIPQVTLVKAEHIAELRLAVNAVRELAGLSAMSFTDASMDPNVTAVKAIHVQELVDAFGAARMTLALASAIPVGEIVPRETKISAGQMSSLRDGVR